MNDRILALCELSNDLLFHKIPRERLAYYVDASLEEGYAVARKFAGQEIRSIYHQYGINIVNAGNGRQGYGVILRGQAVMGEDGCSVEVYQDSIKALVEHSLWEGNKLTLEQAVEIHLAHEFYHVWEYVTQCSVVEKLDPIQSFSFLRLKRVSHINRCGEVAAHAFAKGLLELTVLPNLYDYLYLIGTKKMTHSAFEDMTVQMGALLGT